MENKDIKSILNYIKLLNKEVLSVNDNELLVELLDHIDDVCNIQLNIFEDDEEN